MEGNAIDKTELTGNILDFVSLDIIKIGKDNANGMGFDSSHSHANSINFDEILHISALFSFCLCKWNVSKAGWHGLTDKVEKTIVKMIAAFISFFRSN